MRITKTGNTAPFRKFTRTHHSAQSTCRPVAILTFTMWSSCPVNCECINCNLYFDVCCNPPTPTQKIKTRKIAAKFFNMLSSPSLSADVDLVSSSTNLHAPSTKTLPVSLATDVDWLRSRGRGIIRAMNAYIEPPWIFKSSI